MRRGRNILALALLGACLPATAQAAQSVTPTASLTPERLGHGTTVGFGFQIAGPPGRVPPPLTELDVRYPGDLGIGLSGLGIATCSKVTLEAFGPAGCPADSRMGFGSVLVAIPIGPELVRETGEVAIVRAADHSGHIAMLLYASGVTPVDAHVVFPAILLPAAWPFGGRLHVDVPLVPSLPEGPDVSVLRVRSTIGPRHLTYYEHVHGKTIAYNPSGILLPDRCPRGGFPFAAKFGFLDGSHASARTVVPCPSSKPRLGHR